MSWPVMGILFAASSNKQQGESDFYGTEFPLGCYGEYQQGKRPVASRLPRSHLVCSTRILGSRHVRQSQANEYCGVPGVGAWTMWKAFLRRRNGQGKLKRSGFIRSI